MGFKGKKIQLPHVEAFKLIAKNVKEALYARAVLGFKTSTDPYGQKWGPLHFRKGQPLVLTARLKNSITARVDGPTVILSTPVKYAPTHQFGARQGEYGRTRRNGPIPWGDVQARRFFPLAGRRSAEWDKAAGRAVAGAMKTLFKKAAGRR